MSIYVLSLESNLVVKIFAEHTSNIIGLSWSKTDPTRFASAQADLLKIWDLNLDQSICQIPVSPAILSFEYDPHDSNQLYILLENGDFKTYRHDTGVLSKFNNYSAGKPHTVRCHPNVINKFALACGEGFTLVGKLTDRLVDRIEVENFKQSIEDLAWDPLSENYLLIAYRDGSMFLFDTQSRVKLHSYERQSTGIKRVVWNKKRLGEFFTCDGKVAHLKVWHVSKSAPVSVIKIGVSGVNDLFLLDDSQKMLCTFRDGAVSVYNLSQHRLEFSSEPGHSETIFDIAVKNDDPNVIATCSYDGTIKIWDVLTMKNIETLQSDAIEMGIYRRGMRIRRAVFYGLAWGPEDYIAGCTSLGEVLLYDYKKAKLLHRIRVGPEAPIYRITWRLSDNFIAIPTLNGSVNVLSLQFVMGPRGVPRAVLGVTHVISVSGTEPVGVAFSPIEPKFLAIGCRDGKVRVIDTSREANEFTVLQGHTGRIFNVAWSPLVKNWLASSSDDCSVIVWNFAESRAVHILKGHTSNVRPVVWSTEIAHLLLSGSWDGTIKLWDIRAGVCIYTAAEHHADVYGLCSHPSRPFLYFSCSRDTSIRLWTIEDYVAVPILEAACGLESRVSNLSRVIEQAEAAVVGSDVKFSGETSRGLTELLGKAPNLERWELTVGFFMFRVGERDFFEALKHLQSKFNRVSLTNQVLPFDELFTAKRTEAEELVFSTSMHWLGGALARKEDRLSKAANVYLRLGDFKAYCDLQVELGFYEKAMAIAPRVSMEFWAELATKYAEHLRQKNLQEATNYFLAAGSTTEAIDFMTKQGDFKEALLIAHNKSEGRYRRPVYTQAPDARPVGSATRLEEEESQLNSMAALAADEYFNRGDTILAATQHIVANDLNSAIDKLIRGDELLYALVLAKHLDNAAQQSKIQAYLSRKAEKLQRLSLALSLQQSTVEKQLTVVRMYGPNAAKVLAEQSLPSVEGVVAQCSAQLQSRKYADAIKGYLVGRDARSVFNVTMQCASDLFERPEGLEELFEIVSSLRSLNVNDLSTDQKCELMACASLIGGINACRLGYSVAKALLGTCRNFVNWRSQLLASSLVQRFDLLLQNSRSHSLLPAIQEAKALYGGAEFSLPFRDIKLLGSNLPTSSIRAVPRSSFSGLPISGPRIEEETLVISKAEAMMWAEVNPFSPLNSGSLFNPY
jgi:WD40 repeat protein